MPRYNLAHVQNLGAEYILIPLSAEFGAMKSAEQERVLSEFRLRARQANLGGAIIPVWEDEYGFMNFIAPAEAHAFLQNVTLDWVRGNSNRVLVW